jgi:flagellar basal-body rod protein FlgB
MFKNLDVFKMAHAMAMHAGARQAVIAQNVANADTPGYRAQDMPDFAATYQTRDQFSGLKATRDGHLMGAQQNAGQPAVARDVSTDPNQNGVSIEEQILKAVDVKRQHDRALAIYKSSLGILRTSIRTQ